MSKRNDEEAPSFLDIVTGVAGSSIVFGGLLYAGGWSYLYQYYRHFGLEISDLDIPAYDALIYSLPVIFNSAWSAIILMVIVFTICLLFNLKRVRSKLTTSVSVGVLFISVLFIGFGISRYGAALGNQKAMSDMLDETSNLPNIAIEVVPADSGADDDDAVELSKLEFKLLAHTKGQYFIFRPFTKAGAAGANIELLIIPESRVNKIRIQRGVN